MKPSSDRDAEVDRDAGPPQVVARSSFQANCVARQGLQPGLLVDAAADLLRRHVRLSASARTNDISFRSRGTNRVAWL